MAHLEEESAKKQEGTESEDSNGIEGVTEDSSVPHQGSEGCSARGEMLLPLQQSGAFYQQMLIGEGIQDRFTFKPKRGDGAKEGSLDPSRKSGNAKDSPRWGAQGIGHHNQTPS